MLLKTDRNKDNPFMGPRGKVLDPAVPTKKSVIPHPSKITDPAKKSLIPYPFKIADPAIQPKKNAHPAILPKKLLILLYS